MTYSRRTFLISFLSCCFLVLTYGQDYDYIQYTSKDGLPTNYVYGVIEDNDGYIWAYTENGMSKFDGYTFKNFSTKDGMPGNDVPHCLKDKEGKIWLYTYQNKPAYLQADTFHVVYDQNCVPSRMVNGLVQQICSGYGVFTYEDGQIDGIQYGLIDSVLLLQEPTAFRLDFVEDLPFDWEEDNGQNGRYSFVNIIADSVYYYLTNETISSLNFKDLDLYYFHRSGMVYWKSGNRRAVFFIGKSASKRGKHIYKLGKEEKYCFNFQNGNILLLDIDQASQRWLSIEENNASSFGPDIQISIMDSTFLVNVAEGFLEYDFDGNLIDKVISKKMKESFTIHRSYKDSKGNIWIGTREAGLFFIPKAKRKTILLTAPDFKDKAFEQLIPTEDGKLLGITDNSGVYHILEDTVINLLAPNKKLRFRSAVNTPYGIAMSSSRKGYVIKNEGNQWDVKDFTEVFDIYPDSALLTYGRDVWKSELTSLNNRISSTYDEQENSLYTCFGQSITSFQIVEKNKVKVSHYIHQASVLYYSSFQQKKYLGSPEGVFYLDGQKRIPFLGHQKSLKNISSLFDTKDKLWIGTESNGLFVYDFKYEKLLKVTDAIMIRRIRPDTDSTLLVATNDGVLLVNKENPTASAVVVTYDVNDGLSSNEIRDVYFDGKQFIYVVTSESVHRLDRLIKDETNYFKEDLKITNVEVNKVSVDKARILNSDPFDLSYLENTLDIHYHLLSYASNAKIKYYTKLVPLEEDWQESESRKVNYLSLSPGRYIFQVKAKDVYGNELLSSPLRVVIRKAYWQTTWFELLVGLLLLGLIISMIYYRDKQNREKLNKEKEINRRMASLELSALRAQMNPHFVFNALGAIQYFIQTNDVESADSYLTRFARLMRKYLDSSKEKVINLKDEVELLKIYTDLEKLRFEDLFDVEIKAEGNIQLEEVYLPTMIIQPFVENAINHGLNERRDKQGLLQIHFSKQNNILYCVIKDNGIGRKNAAKNKRKGHRSRGLSIIDEKLVTLRKSGLMDITVLTEDLNPENELFKGTSVSLSIRNMEEDYG